MSGASVPPRVTTTLVTGPSTGAREQLIAAQLSPGSTAVRAVLLEGLPDGHTILVPSRSILLERIAPGCLCCTGNLVLRVTLNRLLRRRPERIYIGLATTEHLDQLRSWLKNPPYDQLLELTPDLHT